MALDENGVSEIEWERLYNPDNSIFLSGRKLMSEVNAIIFLVICTNIFFVVRFFYQHYVLKPIALSFNMRKSYTARFLENGWYTLYYISFFLIGSYVYSQENWSIFPTMNIWLGWPTQPFSTLFRTYYLVELSFYVHCTIALFFETRRKDFNQMLTHHVATFFLVGCSYWYRYHRIGIAILWIHNIADIFLYSAKALNYISKEIKSKTVQIACDGLFVMFALSFFVTRLIFFPFTLIKSSLTEAYYVSVEFPLFYPTNVALLTLLLLHMFWFFLIARIIYIKLFKSKDFDDIRSDSDEDEPEEKPTQKGLEAEPTRTNKNNNNNNTKLSQTKVSKATQKKNN